MKFYGKLAVDHPNNKISRKEKEERIKSSRVIVRAMVGNLAIKHNIDKITVLSNV